jgi:hypothetical protein
VGALAQQAEQVGAQRDQRGGRVGCAIDQPEQFLAWRLDDPAES